jgi:F420-dependent oxidoreductase-like protein
MRFSLMLEIQQGPTWSQCLAMARACERGGFEGLVTSDHYYSQDGRGSSDAWTMLAALAARTERIRLGTMVSPVTFRHPAHLAKSVATVDHVSNGRVDLGIGAGWWEEEHRNHGFPFPPPSERFDMLEEQVEIVDGLFRNETFTFRGRHYALDECRFEPKPVQRPRPPLVVGGAGGPRLCGLIARWADEFNTVGVGPDEAGTRFDRVREAADASGRDQGSLATSVMTWCFVGADERELRERIERAKALDPDVDDEWLTSSCIVGTPEQAAERIAAYGDAGAQRVVLNHSLFDDVGMVDLLAAEVIPRAG